MNITSICTLTTALTPVEHAWPSQINDKASPLGNGDGVPLPPFVSSPQERELHRVAEVRQREGMSRPLAAGLLGMSDSDVARREQPQCDMLLSELYRWSKALHVPASELLNEPDIGLSPPVRLRAQLVRAMKTVRLLEERTRQPAVRRLIAALVDQFVEIMPELRDIGAWPVLGKHRMPKEPGQAYFRGLSLDGVEEAEDGEA